MGREKEKCGCVLVTGYIEKSERLVGNGCRAKECLDLTGEVAPRPIYIEKSQLLTQLLALMYHVASNRLHIP